ADGVPRPVAAPTASRDGARRSGSSLAPAVAGAHARGHPRRRRRAASRARPLRVMLRNRWFRLGATVLVTGLAALYIVSKIDIGKTVHIIGTASPWWLLLCAALTFGTVPLQAWRWQLLLRVRGMIDSFGWLLRTYF